MENQRATDRLAGYVIKLGVIAIVAGLCWYFRSVLVYIILAFVVSLIGQPIMRLFKKIQIKGKSAPNWLLAIFTLLLIFAAILLVVTQIIPVVAGIIRDASISTNYIPDGNILEDIQTWIAANLPWLSSKLNVSDILFGHMKDLVNGDNVSSVIGSLASTVAGIAVGVFSVVFISFFFIKDEKLFTKIISALTPDRIEQSVCAAIEDIEKLLSRYFVGLIIEMIGVALVDFLGLLIIARIGFVYAIGIAFIAGLLNIIPYLGPLIGEILGVVLCVILKYGLGIGLNVNIWLFALIVLAIMLTAQFIDNFLYQPLIYSTSIHARPLEIFIVILIAAHIGGIAGMLAGIPAYTVVRVIASRFFYDKKAVRRLMPNVGKDWENVNYDETGE
ncbi:MAG: AI-2E family transporter [Bacteroidales bacterium]|nr:AI-2E family transporter [Bacteroidales bacterium]